MSPDKAFKRAFTLVEILIALAILAMIVASTCTIFRSSSRSWQKGEERSQRYHTARVAMGKMAKEVSQAVINENSMCRFIGEKKEIKFISFVSTARGVFQLAEIEYWMDKEERFLMRNEEVNPDYDFSTQDNSDILAEDIAGLEFSYYDGLIWSDEWDSEDKRKETPQERQGVLPKAVKIRIEVENRKGMENEAFELVTHLKTS